MDGPGQLIRTRCAYTTHPESLRYKVADCNTIIKICSFPELRVTCIKPHVLLQLATDSIINKCSGTENVGRDYQSSSDPHTGLIACEPHTCLCAKTVDAHEMGPSPASGQPTAWDVTVTDTYTQRAIQVQYMPRWHKAD